MALTLVTAVAVLLAWTGGTSAESFELAETIDKDNFFDKFTFSTIKDPNHSFVNYVDVGKARKNDIVKIQDNGDIYLGVDNTTTLDHEREPGRDSFRIQSKAVYKHGLFVARFTHMPAPVCGSWPAFWTFGSGTWPEAGEIDMYEGWNLNTYNKPTLHVGRPAEVGQCTLNGTKQGAKVLAEDCDNFGATHARNQGCQTEETENSIWGSPEGGTQALFWTSDEIKIYTWPRGKQPANLDDDEIDTDAWPATTPSLHLKTCDIDRAFKPQKIMLDVAFCGIPAGTTFWTKPDHKGESTCYDTTKVPTCDKYVAENPEAFKEVYFQFKDIRHFRVKREAQSSTLVTSATTSSLAKSLASRSGNGANPQESKVTPSSTITPLPDNDTLVEPPASALKPTSAPAANPQNSKNTPSSSTTSSLATESSLPLPGKNASPTPSANPKKLEIPPSSMITSSLATESSLPLPGKDASSTPSANPQAANKTLSSSTISSQPTGSLVLFSSNDDDPPLKNIPEKDSTPSGTESSHLLLGKNASLTPSANPQAANMTSSTTASLQPTGSLVLFSSNDDDPPLKNIPGKDSTPSGTESSHLLLGKNASPTPSANPQKSETTRSITTSLLATESLSLLGKNASSTPHVANKTVSSINTSLLATESSHSLLGKNASSTPYIANKTLSRTTTSSLPTGSLVLFSGNDADPPPKIPGKDSTPSGAPSGADSSHSLSGKNASSTPYMANKTLSRTTTSSLPTGSLVLFSGNDADPPSKSIPGKDSTPTPSGTESSHSLSGKNASSTPYVANKTLSSSTISSQPTGSLVPFSSNDANPPPKSIPGKDSTPSGAESAVVSTPSSGVGTAVVGGSRSPSPLETLTRSSSTAANRTKGRESDTRSSSVPASMISYTNSSWPSNTTMSKTRKIACVKTSSSHAQALKTPSSPAPAGLDWKFGASLDAGFEFGGGGPGAGGVSDGSGSSPSASRSSGASIATNATVAGAGGDAAAKEMAAVTVYRTFGGTVTACPPTATACPVSVTVIPWYVTYCPLTPVETRTLAASTAGATMTVKITIVVKVFRIKGCPSGMPNCPLGSVGTVSATKTLCGGKDCTLPGPTEPPRLDMDAGKSSGSGAKVPAPDKQMGHGILPTFGPSDPDPPSVITRVTRIVRIARCPPGATGCVVGHMTTTVVNCPGPECSSPTAPAQNPPETPLSDQSSQGKGPDRPHVKPGRCKMHKGKSSATQPPSSHPPKHTGGKSLGESVADPIDDPRSGRPDGTSHGQKTSAEGPSPAGTKGEAPLRDSGGGAAVPGKDELPDGVPVNIHATAEAAVRFEPGSGAWEKAGKGPEQDIKTGEGSMQSPKENSKSPKGNSKSPKENSKVGPNAGSPPQGGPGTETGGVSPMASPMKASPMKASPMKASPMEKPEEGSNGKPKEGSDGKPKEGSNGKPTEGSNEKPKQGSNEKPKQGSNEKPKQGSNEKPKQGFNESPSADSKPNGVPAKDEPPKDSVSPGGGTSGNEASPHIAGGSQYPPQVRPSSLELHSGATQVSAVLTLWGALVGVVVILP